MTLPSTGYEPSPGTTDSEYNTLKQEYDRLREENARLTEENGALQAYAEGIDRINANLAAHLEADHEVLRRFADEAAAMHAADDGPEAVSEADRGDFDPYDGKLDEDSVDYNAGADAAERVQQPKYTDVAHELTVVSRGAW